MFNRILLAAMGSTEAIASFYLTIGQNTGSEADAINFPYGYKAGVNGSISNCLNISESDVLLLGWGSRYAKLTISLNASFATTLVRIAIDGETVVLQPIEDGSTVSKSYYLAYKPEALASKTVGDTITVELY